MTDSTGQGHGRAASHGARSLGGSTADRNIVVFGLGLLFCALLIAVMPDLSPAQTGLVSERAHGRITALLATEDLVAPKATVLVLDGERRGETITAILESPTSQAAIPDYQPGDEVLVAIDLQPDGTITYSVVDRWRAPILLTILGALALMTIAIAGWRGLRALTSLAITVVVVMRLLIPLLLLGYSPVALAIGLGILITVLSLLLTQGLSRSTLAAIAGTAVGLVVTGILAVVVSSAARFTSAQGSEEIAIIAQLAGQTIDLSGLLLAAVIFGGLGVLNDVAITQAVTIDEFRSIDPTMPRRELYRRAMSVGTAHLAATVNTLVFAYLGSALPIIVLLALQIHRLDLAVNDEHIAVEVVRTVVGAIGILSAVPLTTAIAAWWVGPPGRLAVAPRRIMALPLGGAAAAAGSVTKEPARTSRRRAALLRWLPRRGGREPDAAAPVAPVATSAGADPGSPQSRAAEAAGPATEDGPVTGQLTLPVDPGPDRDPTSEGDLAQESGIAPNARVAHEGDPAAVENGPKSDPAPTPEPAPPAEPALTAEPAPPAEIAPPARSTPLPEVAPVAPPPRGRPRPRIPQPRSAARAVLPPKPNGDPPADDGS